MIRLALAELRRHPTRVAAVWLAVMIGVGFLVSTTVFLSTESHALGAAATAELADSDVVVQPQDSGLRPDALLGTARTIHGVTAVEPQYRTQPDFRTAGGRTGVLELNSTAAGPAFRWGRLVTGHWPTAVDEIALDRRTTKRAGVGIGDLLTVTDPNSTGRTTGADHGRLLRVVGTVDLDTSLFSGLRDAGFAAPRYFFAEGNTPAQYLITTAPGSAAEVAAAMQRRLGDQADVQTSEQVVDSTARDLTHGVNALRLIALIFGAIALLIGAMIILNTFGILVVQRRRQIGLLRAIGADGRQIRRGLLLEAAVIGLAGSVSGVAFGVGVAAVAAAVTGSIGSGLVVGWPTVLSTAGGGVLITVCAAAVPSRRTLRVSPLEALRPVADPADAARSGRIRSVAALMISILGAAVILTGVVGRWQPLGLAILGALLLAAGVLAGARSFVPVLLHLLAGPVGRTGPVAKLAAANAVRNPGRAAVTCTALMLAVGLIVTLQVGSASVKQTVIGRLNDRFPVDLTVTAISDDEAAVPGSVISSLRRVPGITVTVPVSAASMQVAAPGVAAGDRPTMVVQGPGPEAVAATRSGFAAVNGSDVLATPFTIKTNGWKVGQVLTLRAHGGAAGSFTLRRSNLGDDNTLVVSRTRLLGLDPAAGQGVVWASVPDIDRAGDVLASVRSLTGADTALQLGGSLTETASYTSVLDTLVDIATGLLAVAVLIALIGVGNTLGLSVLERTRESALLRALGLQRRQLRAALAFEAVLLALVAALVGTLAGVVFGWVGTLALPAQASLGPARFGMSVSRTAAVIAMAVVAGAVASVLPARRAARATPVAALAEE